MATDPFSDIIKPVCGEFVEIGQPTFTELISVRQKTTVPAIGNATPDVKISLKELAYGRSCRGETKDPFVPGRFTAIPISSATAAAASAAATAAAASAVSQKAIIESVSKYSLSGKNKQTRKSTAADLILAKSTTEFRSLLTNPDLIDIQSFLPGNPGCPGACPDLCVPEPGLVNPCPFDLSIVFDIKNTYITKVLDITLQIRAAIDAFIATMGFNFRLNLILFGGTVNISAVFPFSEKCGQASYDEMMSALSSGAALFNHCTNIGEPVCGDNIGDLSAPAVEFAVLGKAGTGNTNDLVTDPGCWREGNFKRIIILITNGPNVDNTISAPSASVTVMDAALTAAACNIQVVYVGSPGVSAEGEIYRTITNGANVLLDYPANDLSPKFPGNTGSPGGGGGQQIPIALTPVVPLDGLLKQFIYDICPVKQIVTEDPPPSCASDTDACSYDLAILFDTSMDEISEGPKVLSIKAQVLQTINVFRAALGEDFRLSLNTFGHDNQGIGLVFSDLCGQASYDAFTTKFNQVLNFDPGHLDNQFLSFWHEGSPPQQVWDTEASAFTVNQTALNPEDAASNGEPIVPAPWRDGAKKVMILITNSGSGKGGAFDDNPNIEDSTVTEAANAAASIGAKVIYVGAPGASEEGNIYASITGGANLFLDHPIPDNVVHTNAGGSHEDGTPVVPLQSLIVPFVESLCSNAASAECDGEELAFNGTFNNNIAGWTTVSGTVGWDGSFATVEPSDPLGFGSVRLNGTTGTAIIEQAISGLTANDTMLLFASWCLGGVSGDKLVGEYVDSSNTIIATTIASGTIGDTLTSTTTSDCSENRQTRSPVRVLVPADGIVKIRFTLTGGTSSVAYVDRVVACLAINSCGPGSRNNVQNPGFEEGVEFWDDATNTALTFTDPNVWDSSNLAIIIDNTAENEVRQTITGLTAGDALSLNFELISHTGSGGGAGFVPELQFLYGILKSDNTVLEQDLKFNIETPIRFSINFTVPSDGIIRIFFKNGSIGGIAIVQDVLVCTQTGICEEGFEKISFDNFAIDNGGWSGGIYDADNQQISLNSDNINIQRTYPGITEETFQLSVNVKDAGGVIITLISDDNADQFITPTIPGYYTLSTAVQSSGTVVARIQRASSDINIDDILVCQSITPVCDGSISDVQALIEWQGTPRRPINFFNAIVRYTVRNPLDPFDITELTFVADSEGHIGVGTCDFWKSQIGPATSILQSKLNQSLIGDIDAGDFISVVSRTNWLWSIPSASGTGFTQDNLIINFPNPPNDQLVESVKFLFLINEAVPNAGTDTSPVNPIADCSPDPAVEFDVIIRFTNSGDSIREFRVPVLQNSLWNQTVDFGDNINPWDTVSATNNGIRGTIAQWEEADFLLDAVNGFGLEQCTEPLFFATDGVGDLSFGGSDKFGFSGTAVFVGPCDADILVQDVSVGDVTNEIQSIIVPTASGGTWTISYTLVDDTQTVELPFDTTAEQLRVRLGSLSNINGTTNVDVAGTGTIIDPFFVTFIGDLSGINQKLMVADGTNLTGASSAIVSTESNGTQNERQRISNPLNSQQDFIVTYANNVLNESVPIEFDSSLDTVQSALEGIDGIGEGNILVTGNIIERNVNYTGPYIIDFIGSLANTNVVQMGVNDTYVVTTDWNGGIGNGQNEKQIVEVNSFGGTFTLRAFNIGSAASPFIEVATTQDGGPSDNSDCYDVEFGGIFAGEDIATNNFFSPQSGKFSHSQLNVTQGSGFGGTSSTTNEVQRHCFQWLDIGGFPTNTLFGVKSPSDSIFAPITGSVAAGLLVRGVDSSAAIEAYLQGATGAGASTENDITVTSFSLFGSNNEIQTIVLKNAPSGGTFTLNIEGETTQPIAYNATALDVQNALRSLTNLSDVTVAESGTLPGDVTYTITFAGADGNKNWQTINPNASGLISDSEFADTAPIGYNATPTEIENELVSAASFIDASDISATQVTSDIEAGKYIWRVEFIGAFALQDVQQMQISASGLTGAKILVTETQEGGGTNDKQRLTIVDATSGFFTLTVTIGDIDYKTTSIPWNTGPAGLQAQLIALAPFSDGDLTVMNAPLLQPNYIGRFTIIFHKKFGNVPLIIVDFEDTLSCDPVILAHVPPGPYKYALPICEDIDEDLSCQSGPLLCHPGEGDGENESPLICCDADTIPLSANISTRLDFQRDLFDPSSVVTPGGVRGARFTIRELAVIKGLNPSEYVPYIRNFNTQAFTPASYTTTIDTKMSVVLIENELDTARGRQRVTNHLQSHREILPSRFVWPECDNTAFEKCWPDEVFLNNTFNPHPEDAD